MFPIHFAELNVIPMSALNFKFPECECGRDDVSISIEYYRAGKEPEKVYCWAWAQVGDAFIRGLVDEYSAPYYDNADKQIEAVISALNSSKRFKESLPGFIQSALEFDPDTEL